MMPIMARQFGHIDGHPVGSVYESRQQLHDAGLHKPLRAGISGGALEGADSIVISGGYPDDKDYGDIIIYTGEGGRDRNSGEQVSDQDINNPKNAALVHSELEGIPVRVIRGGHKGSQYAPKSGYRYDGLYRIESHVGRTGIHGFLTWQFRLVKIADGETFVERRAAAGVTNSRAAGPAPVAVVTVQRVVRSSAVVRRVKNWHAHQCQICGTAIETKDGLYSEGAHIQALGSP
ncbi:YDG/SRA domain-containing protein, partial [Micrococcus luteus]|uniref:YDG/SRA domain-containing protein n=1 Tax=Micrococcus luteus TaxID=1270 RepID=UPI00332653F8